MFPDMGVKPLRTQTSSSLDAQGELPKRDGTFDHIANDVDLKALEN